MSQAARKNPDKVGYYKDLARKAKRASAQDTNPNAAPEEASILLIRQRPHREIIIERRNKYDIYWADGTKFGYAEEPGGLKNFLGRQISIFWSIRRFRLDFFDAKKKPVFSARLYHPLRRFFLSRMEVKDASNRPLGAVQRRFSFFTNKCDITDPRNNILLQYDPKHSARVIDDDSFYEWRNHKNQIVATITHTLRRDRDYIRNENDLFELAFYPGTQLTHIQKTMILAAVFYMDFKHFERRSAVGEAISESQRRHRWNRIFDD